MSLLDALFGPGETTREIMRGLREPVMWTVITTSDTGPALPEGWTSHTAAAEEQDLRSELAALRSRVAELEGRG